MAILFYFHSICQNIAGKKSLKASLLSNKPTDVVTLSHRISDKNSENKKNCHEKLLKNLWFGVDLKLYVLPIMSTKLTQTI